MSPVTEDKRLKASVTVTSNGCWRWNRSKYPNGYGHFKVAGGKRHEFAHRASYRVFVGSIPPGLSVCHTCDQRDRINPSHLFLGTQSENLQDASRKGRLSSLNRSRGEEHGSAKLTTEQVVEIRRRIAAGESRASVASTFSVSWTLISLIGRRLVWRHIPEVA